MYLLPAETYLLPAETYLLPAETYLLPAEMYLLPTETYLLPDAVKCTRKDNIFLLQKTIFFCGSSEQVQMANFGAKVRKTWVALRSMSRSAPSMSALIKSTCFSLFSSANRSNGGKRNCFG
jgi:hypothetical protein